MSEQPEAMQFWGFSWFSPFLFRLAPVGFFIGFVRRPFAFPAGSESPGYCIRRISETEYTFMRRIGCPEFEVVMQD